MHTTTMMKKKGLGVSQTALMAAVLLTFATLNLTNVFRAFATTFANRPLGAVVNEAPTILRGKVLNSYTDWGKGAQLRTIFTYTELEVTENLKGSVNEKRILLRQPGGEKDGVELSVPGAARFTQGSDIVVTLGGKDSSDTAYDVLNLTAGKYDVVQENGEPVLVNSLGAAEMYDPSHKGSHEGSYTSKISLSEFKRIIHGQNQERAQQNQFGAPGATPGKAVVREGGVSRDSSPAIAVKSSGEATEAQAPARVTASDAVQDPDRGRAWGYILATVFFAAVGGLIWFSFGGGRNDQS